MATMSSAISVVIGGAVGASFGKAVSGAGKSIADFRTGAEREISRLGSVMAMRKLDLSKYGQLRQDGVALGKAFQEARDRTTELGARLAHTRDAAKHIPSMSAEVKRLTTEFERSQRETAALEQKWQRAVGASNAVRDSLRRTRDEHRKNQEAIKRHRDELSRLAAVEEGRKRMGQGAVQFAAGAATLATTQAALQKPVMLAANYQSIIRDIAIKGDIARTDKEGALSESIRRDASAAGIDRNELAQAVNTLVAGGVGIDEAAQQARSMARFSVGQNADSTDTAKLVLALRQAGITDPKAMEIALGKVAVAGDLGSFEAKDMAKHFGNLMPQMTAFGMAGENATVALANMLQTQMKAAGSADEAANNLANLLSKLTADDTAKKFKDSGINFERSMRVNIAQGFDPIASFIGIVQEAAKRTDPAKAKEMAALQKQIAKTQDPAAAQKMLEGYLEMAGLSEFISDRQAKQAALAAIQNQKDHAIHLRKIQDADGQAKIEKDLADRRAESAKIWGEAGMAWDEALTRFGEALRPVTDIIGQATTGVLNLGSAVLSSGIGKSAAIVGTSAVAGYSLYKTGSGIVNMARGARQVLQSRSIVPSGLPGGGIGGIGSAGSSAAGAAGKAAGKASVLSRVGGAVGKLSPYATKIGAGLAVAGAAYSAFDTFRNAKTDREKAEGYGGAAAGLAGGLAGAKLGAMVGAIGGPIGIAIGGIAGGVLGSVIGDKAGRWLGGAVVQPNPATTGAVVQPNPAPQQLTFSPTIQVTVQGDVKDPRQLADELMPHLKKMFDQFKSQSARDAMFDPAHAW